MSDEQKPVAWMVRDGVVDYQLVKRKEQADHLVAELQKRHELSGALAAFNAVALYAHPAPDVVKQLGGALNLPPIPERTQITRLSPHPVWTVPMMQPGVDLRDWFAGKAMRGILTNESPDWSGHTVAKTAYEMADEMLKAREKK